MTFKKNRRGKKTKQFIEQSGGDEMQLTEEANVSTLRASRGASPAPRCDDAETEEPVNLKMIMKVLSGVGNEVKNFKKTQKQDNLSIKTFMLRLYLIYFCCLFILFLLFFFPGCGEF